MTPQSLGDLTSLVPWLGLVSLLAGVMRWAVTRGDALAEASYRKLEAELERVAAERERVVAERDAMAESWQAHRLRCPMYDYTGEFEAVITHDPDDNPGALP